MHRQVSITWLVKIQGRFEYIETMRALCGGQGTCQYGKRPPNAEGVTSLEPDITKLKEATGFHQEISFEQGIQMMLM